MKELVLRCSEELAEALSDALLEAGVLSVSVEDADEGTSAEVPLFGEPGLEPQTHAWNQNSLVALLPDGEDPAQLLQQAYAILALSSDVDVNTIPAWSVRDVPDADWVRLTQSQFAPIDVDGKVWIVPSWHDVPNEALASDSSKVIIRLDPGLAFGTGSHPTTHLCLAWLAQHMPCSASVLDYGCGSGILGIAAAKLGASTVVGIDIDAQAVQAAEFNATVNGVDMKVGLPDAYQTWQADVVVANILSNPLKVLAPMLCARVQANGRLVLSGILERQAQELIDIYAPWISLSVWRAQDGWVCLHGQRQ